MILILFVISFNSPKLNIGNDVVVKSTRWVRCVMEKTAQNEIYHWIGGKILQHIFSDNAKTNNIPACDKITRETKTSNSQTFAVLKQNNDII